MSEHTSNPYDRIVEDFAHQMTAITAEFEDNLKQAAQQVGKLLKDLEGLELPIDAAQHDSQPAQVSHRGDASGSAPKSAPGGPNIFHHA
ncbi:hypothetical protein GC425_04010 [Corynebacterium sp. zg254]|uniref:Uncharacterized protein n=1 Tax=Corynebacterium zhongnanshanii TaxID=2768834 RepID=A0ABQ6VF90_9CORY|nr:MULTISPECIES: hypothetical protein [Corynebacterium]KAB3522894.1 hypothetical protein F8377_01610 [Corynebacterium zhongnanshanii]MCR5914035.1 hypothetical protein [Corynebacterium sp. zg254]